MTNALSSSTSPAKAKKIAEYLGRRLTVESSIGTSATFRATPLRCPRPTRNEPLGRTVQRRRRVQAALAGSADKRSHIRLTQLVKDSDELYLATDEDREGEAIAWHLIEVLNPQVPVKRMVFHEITPAAIAAAVASPRELDRKMVDSQEARRILDRLYGYEVSPVLWKKVLPQLSAGRVQSVATRIVVQRERERMEFRAASYWSVSGTFAAVEGTRGISRVAVRPSTGEAAGRPRLRRRRTARPRRRDVPTGASDRRRHSSATGGCVVCGAVP